MEGKYISTRNDFAVFLIDHYDNGNTFLTVYPNVTICIKFRCFEVTDILSHRILIVSLGRILLSLNGNTV